MTRAIHAARQFVWHITARSDQEAPSWLTNAEAGLFLRMPPADREEGLAVARRLAGWGYQRDRDLLVAGLLHDVGKSLAPPDVQLRIAITLIEGLVPWLVWPLIRRGGVLARLWLHPEGGAELASQAGLSPEVVTLIREHHSPAFDSRMAALQRADELH